MILWLVSKEDHSDNDCLVCCFLTHGHDEYLWAYDRLYDLDHILSFFTGDKCKTLAGKPKIFIIQVLINLFNNFNNRKCFQCKACRGDKFDDGVRLRSKTDVTDSLGSKHIKIPVYSDFVMAYSTMAGY